MWIGMVLQWQIFHMKVQIMQEKIEEDPTERLQGVLGISDSHRKNIIWNKLLGTWSCVREN